VSQTFARTWAKVFWAKGRVLVLFCGAILTGSESSRHFQGIKKGFEVEGGGIGMAVVRICVDMSMVMNSVNLRSKNRFPSFFLSV
jgi:hypothetical protein